MRLIVQQGHFAQDFAFAPVSQHDRVFVIPLDDRHLAGLDDIHRVVVLAFVEDDLARCAGPHGQPGSPQQGMKQVGQLRILRGGGRDGFFELAQLVVGQRFVIQR